MVIFLAVLDLVAIMRQQMIVPAVHDQLAPIEQAIVQYLIRVIRIRLFPVIAAQHIEQGPAVGLVQQFAIQQQEPGIERISQSITTGFIHLFERFAVPACAPVIGAAAADD